jgi:hypothetical protein
MQPQAYNRETDFTDRTGDDTDNSAINAELDAAALSINEIRDNLALIQKDDGALVNGVVTADSLAQSAFDAINLNVNILANDARAASDSAINAAVSASISKDISINAIIAAETARDASGLNAANAAASALAASNSAAAASTSEAAALVSKNAAQSSQTAAASSAATATSKATESTTAAADALASKNAAQSSQSSTANAAATATTKAGEASSYAAVASGSANASAASATLANTAKVDAQTAQTAAELAKTNAETAQAAAVVAKVAAELAKTNAETAQSAAASSAATASTQAGIATAQATISTTKAAEAVVSASDSAASAVSAASSAASALGNSDISYAAALQAGLSLNAIQAIISLTTANAAFSLLGSSIMKTGSIFATAEYGIPENITLSNSTTTASIYVKNPTTGIRIPIPSISVSWAGVSTPTFIAISGAAAVIGSTQIDNVYVVAGSDVDLTALGSKSDVIYLTGTWADYAKTYTGETITFSRSIGDGVMERVKVGAMNSLSGNEKLVFSDGSVLSYNARSAVVSNPSCAITAVTGYDSTTTTPATPPSNFLYIDTLTPTGVLKCDGTAVSRSAYPALFARIGTGFGSGDGATTFTLPNIPPVATGIPYYIKA